jgi:predicted RNA-binding protein YlqC (UPF0109 family)
MKALIQIMAQALVDHPDQVSINEIGGGHTTVFELKVAKEDTGKVIGKQGRTAKALRTIVAAVAAKTKQRCILEIVEFS